MPEQRNTLLWLLSAAGVAAVGAAIYLALQNEAQKRVKRIGSEAGQASGPKQSHSANREPDVKIRQDQPEQAHPEKQQETTKTGKKQEQKDTTRAGARVAGNQKDTSGAPAAAATAGIQKDTSGAPAAAATKAALSASAAAAMVASSAAASTITSTIISAAAVSLSRRAPLPEVSPENSHKKVTTAAGDKGKPPITVKLQDYSKHEKGHIVYNFRVRLNVSSKHVKFVEVGKRYSELSTLRDQLMAIERMHEMRRDKQRQLAGEKPGEKDNSGKSVSDFVFPGKQLHSASSLLRGLGIGIGSGGETGAESAVAQQLLQR